MSSFNKYPHVFSPIKIGGMEVKNRVQFSPMVSSLSTPTGGVSPELLGYIKYQAQSGVGVITIGSTPINHTNGVDFFGALDVTSDDNTAQRSPASLSTRAAPLRSSFVPTRRRSLPLRSPLKMARPTSARWMSGIWKPSVTSIVTLRSA